MTLFRREGPQCVAILQRDEARTLREFIAEYITLLNDGFDHDDPVIERLFPDIYPDDPAAGADFRTYTEEELKAAKLDQAGAMLAALPGRGATRVTLDLEAAEAWLRALTDLRLALGIRLGLTDDSVLEDEMDEAVLRNPTSSRVVQLCLYSYLSFLQQSLLDAIIGEGG
jgi:uncharacterized protein DUF2017